MPQKHRKAGLEWAASRDCGADRVVFRFRARSNATEKMIETSSAELQSDLRKGQCSEESLARRNL